MNNSIKSGLKTLLKQDSYLLSIDANERTITHRLGMYYQFLFPEWDVDCEYNKNLNGPKEITIDPQEFLMKMVEMLELDSIFHGRSEMLHSLREEEITIEDINLLRSQLKEPERLRYDNEFDVIYFVLTLRDGRNLRKLIYPDIIIHERGTANNHIVIEAKKSSNNDYLSRAYDIVKLLTLVNDKHYKYKRGYFIDIPTGKHALMHKTFVFSKLLLDKRVSTVRSLSR